MAEPGRDGTGRSLHGRPAGRPGDADAGHLRCIPLFGHRLHEIRPLSTTVRIICIFGPDRTLVLLYAGDKEGDWNRWYHRAIPEAARLYAEYVTETGQAS